MTIARMPRIITLCCLLAVAGVPTAWAEDTASTATPSQIERQMEGKPLLNSADQPLGEVYKAVRDKDTGEISLVVTMDDGKQITLPADSLTLSEDEQQVHLSTVTPEVLARLAAYEPERFEEVAQEPSPAEQLAQPGTQRRADQMIGKTAVDIAERQLGTVDRIVRDKESEELFAVITADESLDLQQPEILVPVAQLKHHQTNQVQLNRAADAAQLEQMATFDGSRYETLGKPDQAEQPPQA